MIDPTLRAAFYVLTLGGIAAAFVAIAALLVASVRARDADVFPRGVPWRPAAVGLVVALVAFWVARLVRGGGWPVVEDLAGLVVVLGVASAGFGTTYQWWRRRRHDAVRWTVPLGLSLVTGLVGGLSTVAV